MTQSKIDKQHADEDRWITAYVRGETTISWLETSLRTYHSGKALKNHLQMAIIEKEI